MSMTDQAAAAALQDDPSAIEPLIRVRNLSVSFHTARGRAEVLRDVSIDLKKRRIIGVVGESGSGKSTLASAILRLLPSNLDSIDGTIHYDDKDLLTLSAPEMERLRGNRFSMIFQDPMTALNPVFRVSTQMIDLQRRNDPGASRAQARARAIEMLNRVGIPDPERRIDNYPHEFSGGMRQRVMIAAALLCEPDLLIADEPTTALDPTIEAQIVQLIDDLHTQFETTIMLISHSLGLIFELCQDVVVLYAGKVVETGPTEALFHDPRHPYTQALLACEITEDVQRGDQLVSIPGEVPDVTAVPKGCIFAGRCPLADDECRAVEPPLTDLGEGRTVACLKA